MTKRFLLTLFLFHFFFNTPLVHLPQCTLFGPEVLHNLCFSFLLGTTSVPMLMQNFGGFANAVYSTYYDNLFEFSVPLNFRTAIHSSSTTWEVITISLSNLNLWLLKSYKFEVFEAFAKVIFWLRLLYLCCCERSLHTTENTRDNKLLSFADLYFLVMYPQRTSLGSIFSVFTMCIRHTLKNTETRFHWLSTHRDGSRVSSSNSRVRCRYVTKSNDFHFK